MKQSSKMPSALMRGVSILALTALKVECSPDFQVKENRSNRQLRGLAESRIPISRHLSSPPKSALLVIDMQNDFCEEGTLPVAGGRAIVPLINRIRKELKFDLTVFTQDWHGPDHISWASNHDGAMPFLDTVELNYISDARLCGSANANLVEKYLHSVSELECQKTNSSEIVTFQQTLWPDHCLQNSWGAAFVPDLNIAASSDDEEAIKFVKKGVRDQVDSYSAVYNIAGESETDLPKTLEEYGIENIFVVGLALDYCVVSTALDTATKLGLNTTVIMDATRAVSDVTKEEAIEQLDEAGVHMMNSTALLL